MIGWILFNTRQQHDLLNNRINVFLGHSGIGTDTYCHGYPCGNYVAMPVKLEIVQVLTTQDVKKIISQLPNVEP